MQPNRHISTAFKSMGTILGFNGARSTHSELTKRGQQILFCFFPNSLGRGIHTVSGSKIQLLFFLNEV